MEEGRSAIYPLSGGVVRDHPFYGHELVPDRSGVIEAHGLNDEACRVRNSSPVYTMEWRVQFLNDGTGFRSMSSCGWM